MASPDGELFLIEQFGYLIFFSYLCIIIFDFAIFLQNEDEMLLEFRTKNYKSFLDEMIFSMEPAPKQQDLKYSILKEKIGSKVYKGLCSAVIYGPNASGKTNLIGAMDTLRALVMRGDIKNNKEPSRNVASKSLELIPNNTLKEVLPTEFYIKFTTDGILFEYTLHIQIGLFVIGRNEDSRKILKETLVVNNELLFEREEANVRLGEKFSKFSGFIAPAVFKHEEMINVLMAESINDKELFLVNGFKNIISKRLADSIINWFSLKLVPIYDSSMFETGISFSDTEVQKEGVYVQELVNDVARELGLNCNCIGYKKDDEDGLFTLTSIYEDIKVLIPSEIIESTGTIRFLNFLLPVLMTLATGQTLIIDELDNSLHPMVLMNIINLFHNDEINKNNAQLIFNTHNPIFLNADLYRRDEIKFVDRDAEGKSIHYSLAQITPCNGRVRSGADYMKNYFINRYGAIKNFDITDTFAKLLELEGLSFKGVLDVRKK